MQSTSTAYRPLPATLRKKILSATPKPVLALLERYSGRLFLAGGFLRAVLAGEEPSDIDLFATDSITAITAAIRLKNDGVRDRTLLRHKDTRNAYTVVRSDIGPPVQIIRSWHFETAEATLDSFDFTVTQAALYMDAAGKWQTLASKSLLSDLKKKTLAYTAPSTSRGAYGPLLRTLRYASKGYHTPHHTLATLIADVALSAEGGAPANPGAIGALAMKIQNKLRDSAPYEMAEAATGATQTQTSSTTTTRFSTNEACRSSTASSGSSKRRNYRKHSTRG
jgi:hypothetical protein